MSSKLSGVEEITTERRQVYWVHGMELTSNIALDARGPGTGEIPIHELSVTAFSGQSLQDDLLPSHQLLSWVDSDGRSVHQGKRLISTYSHPGGYLMRYHDLCDVKVDGDLSRVCVIFEPCQALGLISTIIGTGVCGLVATLAGARSKKTITLHASAVSYGEHAVAFVGPSGSYKSTCAALACSSGASLVTDDTLVLDISAGRVRTFPGTRSTRLRRERESQIVLDRVSSITESPDDRDVVRFVEDENWAIRKEIPLKAIVLTELSTFEGVNQIGGALRWLAESETLVSDLRIWPLTRVTGSQSLIGLVKNSRVGLHGIDEVAQQQLVGCRIITDSVPVFQLG